MTAVQLTLLCWLSVATLAWAQSAVSDVSCERLKDPTNGKVIYVYNTTTVGSTILFKCDDGYTTYSARCLPGGIWDQSPPTCPELSCERLEDPAHGKVIYAENKTSVGSTVLFRCNYGHTAYTARCLPGGTWDQSPPTCPAPPNEVTTGKDGRQCPQLRDPPHGKLLSNGSTNSSAVFACNEGYVMKGSPTLVCQPGGTWEPQQLPTCVVAEVSCERLKGLANGKVIYVDKKTTVGSTILFMCNDGYTKYSARCLPGGIWNESPPTCPEVDCERPKDPAHGKVIYIQNKTSVGSTILFKCNHGLLAYNASCQPGGTWDRSPPTCPELSCERLEDPAHGKVIYAENKTSVGSTVSFRCNYGHMAYTARCLPGGTWDQSPPTCPGQAPFPWVIAAGVGAAVLVLCIVAVVCLLCRRRHRRPTGYRRQIRKPSASDSHTQNEVAHLHKPYPVTSL
ncbi:P-selectin-like isoform X2 [Ornithodoros turicata]|uniref:P-selectin-like isoform X2 n=1 Tax=Ornithodoros turicata TaxID=34597 RepID=UPI00313A1C46